MTDARRCAAMLAFAACAAAGCGGFDGNAPLTAVPGARDAATNPCAGVTPPPTPAASRVLRTGRPLSATKAPVAGLVDLGQVHAVKMPEPPYNTLFYVCRRQRAISGIVVNDTWAAMQPNGESEKIDTSVIDAALSAIRRYNATPGRSLTVRLRIWGGLDAPVWAKRLGRGPVSICDQDAVRAAQTTAPAAAPVATPTPCPAVAVRTVGAFWSDAYDRAWQSVQLQVAAKYDDDPLVREISVTSCDSLTDEPFVQPEDDFSRERLAAAGYTDGRYKRCLSRALERDYAPYWHRTLVDFIFNPFRRIDTVRPATDLAFTERVMDACRTLVGARCVLDNETLGKFTPAPSPSPGATPAVAESYFEMWSYMRSRGGTIAFQTAASPNLLRAWGSNDAGWNAAVRLARRFGASSLELWPPERFEPCTAPSRAWSAGYTCFAAHTMLKWKNLLR